MLARQPYNCPKGSSSTYNRGYPHQNLIWKPWPQPTLQSPNTSRNHLDASKDFATTRQDDLPSLSKPTATRAGHLGNDIQQEAITGALPAEEVCYFSSPNSTLYALFSLIMPTSMIVSLFYLKFLSPAILVVTSILHHSQFVIWHEHYL